MNPSKAKPLSSRISFSESTAAACFKWQSVWTVHLIKIPAQSIFEDKKLSTSNTFSVSLLCFQSFSKFLWILIISLFHNPLWCWFFQAGTHTKIKKKKTPPNFYIWNKMALLPSVTEERLFSQLFTNCIAPISGLSFHFPVYLLLNT